MNLTTPETIDFELEKGAQIPLTLIQTLHLLKKFQIGIKLGFYRLVRKKEKVVAIEMEDCYRCD